MIWNNKKKKTGEIKKIKRKTERKISIFFLIIHFSLPQHYLLHQNFISKETNLPTKARPIILKSWKFIRSSININTILAPPQSLFECFALTSSTRLRLMYCLVLSSVGEKQTTLHPPSCTSMAASWSCHWLQDRHTAPLLSSRPPPSKPFSITDAPTVEICTSVYFIIMNNFEGGNSKASSSSS